MITENFDNRNSSVSAPPEPKVAIRTMESDIEDIERGGGEIIAPRFFDIKNSEISANIGVPGYSGPEKSIFSPTGAVLSEQEPSFKKEASGWKTAWVIVAISAIIFVFGFLGYFFVSRWFFPAEKIELENSVEQFQYGI